MSQPGKENSLQTQGHYNSLQDRENRMLVLFDFDSDQMGMKYMWWTQSDLDNTLRGRLDRVFAHQY